jgi:hypothetical protein
MHDLNKRKNRNAHEKSHQSATVGDEIDETKTLWSSFNIKLILSKHHVDRTHRFTEKDLSLNSEFQYQKSKLPSQIYFFRFLDFILLIIILNDIIDLIKDLITWTKTVAINFLVDRIFIANKIQLRKLWNHGLSVSRTIQVLIIFANRCPFRPWQINITIVFIWI